MRPQSASRQPSAALRLALLVQVILLAACASNTPGATHICVHMQPTGDGLLIDTCDGGPAVQALGGKQRYQSVFGEVLSVQENGRERTIGLRLETVLVESNGSVWLDDRRIATAATSVSLVGSPGHELRAGGVGLGDIVDTTGKILEGTATVAFHLAAMIAAGASGQSMFWQDGKYQPRSDQ